MLATLVGFFAFGSVVVLAVTAVVAPWAYHLGGTFHWLPQWQGWGRMHAKGGDFVLSVTLVPSRRGGTWAHLSGPSVLGRATLCTPQGQRFELYVSGTFVNNAVGVDTDGQPMSLSVHSRPFWAQFNSERRPSFDLFGSWHNPNLVMDDHGTLASAFLADGRAYAGPKEQQPPPAEPVSITLSPGSRSDFEAACNGR